MRCDTKYPILLLHGMGFHDRFPAHLYWGRIPRVLRKHGARVYFGGQDGNATTMYNARNLVQVVHRILRETGAEKINIIAHSKGGLDARYAISTLGMGGKVASLTTMSTPHHGSKTVDLLLKAPDFLVRFAGFCTDLWFRLLGDREPDSYSVFRAFTTDSAKAFNALNPDDARVYYQSYSFVMKHPFSDILLWLPSLAVHAIEGENDGLLTPEATRWTNHKGVIRSNSGRGISHCDEVDLRRRRLTRRSGEGVSDIVDIYKDTLCELIERGF